MPLGSRSAAAHDGGAARGDVVGGQRELVRCGSAGGARYTAATGFFAADCAAAPREGRWRVLACRHVALVHGGLWLVEAVALDGGRRVWLPLPSHDWA